MNWTTVSPAAEADVGRIDAAQVAVADAAQARAQPVDLAAGAEPGHRGEQCERRHQQGERPAQRVEAGRVGGGGQGQDDQADRVREPRRAGVLELALAEPRLDELEVGDAGQAPAPAEREPQRELEREQAEQRPPAGQDRDQREGADRGLVEPRRAGVDHVQIAVGVCASNCHFGSKL